MLAGSARTWSRRYRHRRDVVDVSKDEGSRGRRAPNRGRRARPLNWSDGRGDDRLVYVSSATSRRAQPEDRPADRRVRKRWRRRSVEGSSRRAPKDGDYSLTSPPAVVNNVIVVGAAGWHR
jgi:hypothetical protein